MMNALRRKKREMNPEQKKALRCAIDLISDPEKWTRFAEARDRRSDPVPAWSPQAVKWCMIGAFRKCARDANLDLHDAEVALTHDWHNALGDKVNGTVVGITSMNDGAGGGRGREAVIAGARRLL